jgi:hypothetical protein
MVRNGKVRVGVVSSSTLINYIVGAFVFAGVRRHVDSVRHLSVCLRFSSEEVRRLTWSIRSRLVKLKSQKKSTSRNRYDHRIYYLFTFFKQFILKFILFNLSFPLA